MNVKIKTTGVDTYTGPVSGLILAHPGATLGTSNGCTVFEVVGVPDDVTPKSVLLSFGRSNILIDHDATLLDHVLEWSELGPGHFIRRGRYKLLDEK